MDIPSFLGGLNGVSCGFWGEGRNLNLVSCVRDGVFLPLIFVVNGTDGDECDFDENLSGARGGFLARAEDCFGLGLPLPTSLVRHVA